MQYRSDQRRRLAQQSLVITLFQIFATCLLSIQASAATYYVRMGGDNANDGLSPNTAWRGIDKVNSVSFEPGDNIFFEGGQTFTGHLYFDREDSGTASNPITIGTFGSGRATINAGFETGLFAYNTAGLLVKDLNFVGAGPSRNKKNGITFLNGLPGDIKLDGVTISNVNVSGFGQCGISIAGWNDRSGYKNVRIIYVAAFDNLDAGISTIARAPRAHSNVYIGYSRAFRNYGNPELQKNTGNGIIMGGVTGGMIERCVAYENGKNNVNGGEGGIGIWTYDSDRVVIQFNESHSNQTSGHTDGGGFDLDNNVQDSFLQYNYSHNNDGSGLLLGTDAANTRNTIRFNISHNDGRKNGYAGMYIYGPVNNADIYNNTVILSQTSGAPAALAIQNGARNIRFRNNIFYTTGGARLVTILPGHTELFFQGNCYYAADGPFSIVQDGNNYTTLAGWQDARGQEVIGGQRTGFDLDPQFTKIGSPRILNDATALNSLLDYRLKNSSPLWNRGLDLRSQVGLTANTRDFFLTSSSAINRSHPGAHAFGGVAGYPTLCFQNADGRLVAWYMQNTILNEAKFLREGVPINSSTWRAFSTADINNDGNPDLVFQNANGTVAAWLMNETIFIGSAVLRRGFVIIPEWRAFGMADINRDGKADVLFQNPTGRLLAWFMDGTNYLGESQLVGGQTPGVGWRAVGAADFNADGSNDVLFQHRDGPLAVWLMNGSELLQVQPLRSGTPTSVWRIVSIADLDQDGNSDIIWRHANGQLAMWKMKGTEFVSSAFLRNGQPVAASWRVIGSR